MKRLVLLKPVSSVIDLIANKFLLLPTTTGPTSATAAAAETTKASTAAATEAAAASKTPTAATPATATGKHCRNYPRIKSTPAHHAATTATASAAPNNKNYND